jgi:hypothetical protein
MDRRRFLQYAVGGLGAASINPLSLASSQASELAGFGWSHGMPPLFCTAYIDPGIDSQKGQERFVAKYPLALVPQDDRKHFRRWRDDVRNINPEIKLLAYQMVIEETTVPGPGHDFLRQVKDSWVSYPGGYTPTVTFRTAVGKRDHRIYDPRSNEWQNRFLEACHKTLNSYPYQGLFLDQCTVYAKAALIPSVRDEMHAALQSALYELRKAHPDKIIIGNSRYSWGGLNGEMNESRPLDMAKESSHYQWHVKPRYELFHYYMNSHLDEVAKDLFVKAISNQMFYGAGINAQTVRWYPFMDDVLSEHGFLNK